MKKLISGVLVAVLLLSIFVVPASAKMKVDEAEYFHSRILAFEEKIDVSGLGYKVSEIYDLAQELHDLKYEYADMFFFEKIDRYTSSNDEIASISVSYSYTKEQVKFVEDYAQEQFLSKLGKDWTKLEKILYIHDKMITDFQYDVRLFDPEQASLVGRDIYEMFTYGQGVCQAYSNTFMYLMEKIGVECKLVASDAANHEWNAVKLDGEWYHIDVTQDDPVYAVSNTEVSKLDLAGRVDHTYFLASDESLWDKKSGGSHYDWYYLDGKDVSCDSDKYLKGYEFRDALTAYVPIGDYWYFIEEDGCDDLEIKKTRDFKDDDELFSIPAEWAAEEHRGYWPGCYTGLSGVGEWLIYNTDVNVCAYNVKTREKKVLFTLSEIKKANAEIPDKAHIYGSKLKDGKIYCQISLSPTAKQYYTVLLDICANGHKWVVDIENSKEATKEEAGIRIEICANGCGEKKETVIPAFDDTKSGDCNGDNAINAADLAILKKGIAGLDATSSLMDCNKDGIVNASDLAILKKFIAGLISALF